MTKVFRFEFSKDFVSHLENFAKDHREDERKVFKQSWQEWCQEMHAEIATESARLAELGFTGDMMDKMFMSVRYYFRKKKCSPIKDSKPRKKYSYLDPLIIDLINKHVDSLEQRGFNGKQERMAPSKGYAQFCECHNEDIAEYLLFQRDIDAEVEPSEEENGEHIKEYVEKIKKAYKNLYYKRFSV